MLRINFVEQIVQFFPHPKLWWGNVLPVLRERVLPDLLSALLRLPVRHESVLPGAFRTTVRRPPPSD